MTDAPGRPGPVIDAARHARYVCGHSARELRRLELQARVYDPFTRRALQAAGLTPGMHVVDVGCGAGDVSLLAADLVGPGGAVVGVDRSDEAIAEARQRARDHRGAQLDFVVADLEAWQPPSPADAVVGRFVLMHQRDPVALVARVSHWVRAGGVVAFIESDIASFRGGGHSRPPSATYDRIVGEWDAVLTAAGAHVDMGSHLPAVLQAAGLHARTELAGPGVRGGAESPLVPFAVESLRSMLPLARALGIDVTRDDDADRLEDRLRDELIASGGVMVPPPVVAAWGHAGR